MKLKKIEKVIRLKENSKEEIKMISKAITSYFFDSLPFWFKPNISPGMAVRYFTEEFRPNYNLTVFRIVWRWKWSKNLNVEYRIRFTDKEGNRLDFQETLNTFLDKKNNEVALRELN